MHRNSYDKNISHFHHITKINSILVIKVILILSNVQRTINFEKLLDWLCCSILSNVSFVQILLQKIAQYYSQVLSPVVMAYTTSIQYCILGARLNFFLSVCKTNRSRVCNSEMSNINIRCFPSYRCAKLHIPDFWHAVGF